jgi:hypothetical protein
MSREKVQAWRDALSAATEARKEVDIAYAAFFTGTGPAPPKEQLDRAKELSKLADKALSEAVGSLSVRR